MGSNSFLDPKYDGLSANETIRQVYRDNLLEDQTKALEEQAKALERQAELIKEEQERAIYEQLEKECAEYEREMREKKRKAIYKNYHALLEKIEYSKDYFMNQYGREPESDKLYEAQFGTFKEWLTNHKKLEILKNKADYEWNLYLEIRNKEVTHDNDNYFTEEYYNSIGIYPPRITEGTLGVFVFFIFMEILFSPIMFIDASEGKSIFSIATMIIGGLSALVLLVTILENIGKVSAHKRKVTKKQLQWKNDKAWYDKKMEEAEKERRKFDEIINAIELYNNKTENFSTSTIQKELKVGYARAEKIYNEMKELGIIDNKTKESEDKIEKMKELEITDNEAKESEDKIEKTKELEITDNETKESDIKKMNILIEKINRGEITDTESARMEYRKMFKKEE